MLDPQQAKVALRKLFQRTPAVMLDALCRTLETRSRTSVFRRLKALGYLTSFTHTGRYYTLPDVPQFDALGLWHYRDVGFSRAGSLRATVVELVDSSPAGRTHRELQELLRVRAHNELLDLVRAEKVRREAMATRGALYVSTDRARASEQLERRLKSAAESTMPVSGVVIEVLLELVHAAKIEAAPGEVAQRLSARGVRVTVGQVREVFDRYRLGGKKGARLPRSRR